jgi:pantoate--beta-alanine ligase
MIASRRTEVGNRRRGQYSGTYRQLKITRMTIILYLKESVESTVVVMSWCLDESFVFSSIHFDNEGCIHWKVECCEKTASTSLISNIHSPDNALKYLSPTRRLQKIGHHTHRIVLSTNPLTPSVRTKYVHIRTMATTNSTTKAVKPILYSTISAFRNFRRTIKQQQPNLSIGFVPTMGALHEGHLSLVREARQQNDIVIASVFVNPTQFGKGEDFDKYPRQLEEDSKLLGEHGVDHLLAPSSIEEMYGQHHVTFVDCTGFDDIPEGVARPGHFRGVATIVTKLFNIVQPSHAYFGQKDAAQCVLIQRIVEDLNMDIRVVVMNTIRESDGLAKSSRNAYLTPVERQAAPVVYRSLMAAKDVFDKNPSSVSSAELVATTRKVLQSEPLVSEIQYISVESKATMKPISQPTKEDGAVISLACKVGSVRLIDNIVL